MTMILIKTEISQEREVLGPGSAILGMGWVSKSRERWNGTLPLCSLKGEKGRAEHIAFGQESAMVTYSVA